MRNSSNDHFRYVKLFLIKSVCICCIQTDATCRGGLISFCVSRDNNTNRKCNYYIYKHYKK